MEHHPPYEPDFMD